MMRQFLVYLFKFIQIIFLAVSVVLLVFPLAALIIYQKTLNDFNLRVAFYEASYPWSLIQTPTQFFLFAGIVFFIGLALFIVSYVFGKISSGIRK